MKNIVFILALAAAAATQCKHNRAWPSTAVEQGAPTIVRQDINVPWACAGETSIVQVPRIEGQIRRVRAVIRLWSMGSDIVQVPPWVYIAGPPDPEPRMTVRRFTIEDPEWLSQLEGTGFATLYVYRRDGASETTCSGARVHLFIELEEPPDTE